MQIELEPDSTIPEEDRSIADNFASMGLTLMPNPAQEQVDLSFDFDQTELLQATLMDLNGKILQTQNATLQQGFLSFDIAHLSAGIYVVRALIGGQRVVSERLVKVGENK